MLKTQFAEFARQYKRIIEIIFADTITRVFSSQLKIRNSLNFQHFVNLKGIGKNYTM